MNEPVTIVSGLPRSGTSMMMRMLEAGGIELVVDHVRAPDDDNPRGYYEFEPVKKIKEDASWLEGARGRAVKMVSMLLLHLPPDRRYKVIFMQRNMDETLASQAKMLARSGQPPPSAGADEQMARLFTKHLARVRDWLASQPHIDTLYVKYSEVVRAPRPWAERIQAFLDRGLDVEAMAGAVDPSLYRNRAR